jgi:hypothetical protein
MLLADLFHASTDEICADVISQIGNWNRAGGAGPANHRGRMGGSSAKFKWAAPQQRRWDLAHGGCALLYGMVGVGRTQLLVVVSRSLFYAIFDLC